MINGDIYNVIGLMSGTSLDGADIAFCRFTFDQSWKSEIISATTIPYPEAWKKQLENLENAHGLVFQQTHVDYGVYLGNLVNEFIQNHAIKKVDFISSHGHTIFHQPEKKLTVQIGSGSAIAAACRLPVVCDFRSLDVALGGQGAPLVPIGDKLLFPDYDFCLNLGGFANVSYQYNSQRIAYDICPVNIVMNFICEKLGKEYDDNGELAQSGNLNNALLNALNKLDFYNIPLHTPKSLGKEWVLKNVYPLFENTNLPEEDLLRTFCEHIAVQIAKALENMPKGKLLISGGGTYNNFLIECIKKYTVHTPVIPDKNIIEFKEALLFAFLGVLRIRNEVNCLKSVTGASRDSIGGTVYLGN